jgi:hypothetical protein
VNFITTSQKFNFFFRKLNFFSNKQSQKPGFEEKARLLTKQ